MSTSTKKSKTFNFTYLQDKFNRSESDIREALIDIYGEDANTIKSINVSDLTFLDSKFSTSTNTEATQGPTEETPQDEPKALTQGDPRNTSEAITDTKANTQALRSIPIEMATDLEHLALKDETVARLLDTADFIEATEDAFWSRYWEFRGNNSVNRSLVARQAIEARRMEKAKATSELLGKSVRESEELRKETQTASTEFHTSLMEAYFQ